MELDETESDINDNYMANASQQQREQIREAVRKEKIIKSLALRTTSHLMFGVIVIYEMKVRDVYSMLILIYVYFISICSRR